MDLDGQWAEYARLSKLANSRQYNRNTLAADDAANALLERMAHGEATTPGQVANLVGNKARRARRREAILTVHTLTNPETPFSEEARLEARDELHRARSACSDRDWKILIFNAQGYSNDETAQQMAMAVGTVKSIISRTRTRLAA